MVYEENGRGLSPLQERAIAALLEGLTIKQTAKRCGVSRQTIYDWLRMPEFISQLRESEGALIDHSVRRLLSLQNDALDTLDAVLNDPHATTATRLRAAQSVIEFTLKLRELRNLEERLAALEAQVSKSGGEFV